MIDKVTIRRFLLTDMVIFLKLFSIFPCEAEIMRAVKRKVADMTVDELKGIIHEAISEDMEIWRETFEIMADSKLMGQIRQADLDRATGKKGAFIAWDDLKNA
jgi:hypothetical protein